ncbi:hypothetical protein DQ238_07625 [Geodermatophilus sp. TF02-6]|nr:FtsK/SpoIIIE domain-containing protein [Geodermatophilus sp. TF02-6]RBY80901.1 hypothetical protein DQ238_07625 [Geodermatophilus sp. TF02-6]
MRLTVHDTDTGFVQDVEVRAQAATSVASLLSALPVRVGTRRCYVGSQAVDPTGTLGTSPLLQGATISVGAPASNPRTLPDGVVGALRVVAGCDARTAVWLPPGGHLIGRETAAAVLLHDGDVSRRHAQLDVRRDGEATLTDVGSTNGTRVDGDADTGPVTLNRDSVVEIGGNRLQWVSGSAPLRTARSSDGRLEFNRAFAPAPAVLRTAVDLPVSVHSPARTASTLVIGVLVPLALGVTLALALGHPAMLLFALLGPVTVLLTAWSDRRQRRANDRERAAAQQAVTQRLTAHVAEEEALRRALAPDPVDLTLAATGAARGLWPRNADSPDGLVLRVGLADEPASVDLRGQPWTGFEPPVLHDVPVTVDLRTIGVLGVVGSAGPAAALLRWLLVQLGTLRSPDDLRLVVISSGDGEELAWTRWLPHLDAGEAGSSPCWVGNTAATRTARIAELKTLVATRTAARGTAFDVRFTDEVVVVLDGALELRRLSGMKEVLRDGPSVGVYTICVDRHDMNECRGLCELEGTVLRLTRSRDDRTTTIRPEGVDHATAERLARAVAPMRDRLTLAGAEAAVPYPVRFLDLLGMGAPTAEDVLELWRELPGPTTEVPLGADASGLVTVDLAGQGPHTMLGGATGAGKSILLQTLVTSLLLSNRSDELDLVLVDFKGGSAFLPFEDCPQVVGLIRSTGETPADVFDEAAAIRVLASVRAEVRRRESLLARYGGEIDEYCRARCGDAALPALPRLVMVFDEFARVLEVSPDFLRELVNVAAKGRSLGMHLVLATQSLQGKLSAELKNNIDLRVTLRQNEPADSVEVLGVPDAAVIPGRLRGRGMILCTKDETRTPRLFQSGYLGDPPPVAGAQPARVRIVEWAALGAPRPQEPSAAGGAVTDQQLAIAAIEEAARRLGLPAPHRPLQPPLPAHLGLEELSCRATAAAAATAVPFGLADDPDDQAQPPAALDLAGTDRLLVAGGPQSGRTTFVRALVESLARRFRPDQAHLYLFEHQPAGLAAYAELPHCGGVFSPAEPDRVRRLVTWLDGEVQRRKVAGSGADPWIVCVIDGWEHFENRTDPAFVETSLLKMLRGVITAGPPVGVHVVAVGGQAMLSSRVPDLYSRRLLLPFPKEETRRAYLPSGTVSPPVLPGRAVDAASGDHVQVCRPSRSPSELVGLAPAELLPKQFPSLPVRVSLDELCLPSPLPSPTWIPLGVGGPEVETIGVDFFGAGPHTMLVSGPAGSGRSTAALTVITGLRCVGVDVLVVAPPRSPLATLVDTDLGVRAVVGTTVTDAELREAVADFGEDRYAVVVDDFEQITVTPSQENWADVSTLLEEATSPASLGRQALVLVGDATPVLNGQRRSLMRVANEVLTSGTRLLLTPTVPLVAREHGFSLEPDQFFASPPGAGYITFARQQLVRVALL